ncbi:recombinase family protein [Geodermatophilus sp. URMC 62]|uniref:recombinase family protein n=1 Tax=Geodermatophilus sp. URMC 62 TaxID=3423414 RepID=UPI00406C1B4F
MSDPAAEPASVPAAGGRRAAPAPAHLRFFHGPMDCGKSTLALQVDHNQGRQGRSGLLLTQGDRSARPQISSRVGLRRAAEQVDPGTDLLLLVRRHWAAGRRVDYLVVDEAQFLTPAQVDQLAGLVDASHVDVYAFGLTTDFRTRLFPPCTLRRMSSSPGQAVGVYLRISRSDDRSTSIAKQRSNTRRRAEQGWPGRDVREFVDDGVSASKGKARAGLDALMAAVRDGELAAVVVDTLDRLTRDRGARALWDLAAECEVAGVALVGASQDIDVGTASGEMSASVLAAAARFEARRTAERVKSTNEHRRARGLRALGGPPVWGLMRAGDGFVPDPERGPILLDAIDRVIAGELSIRGMAEEFTRRGVPTARGGTVWSHRAASKVLRSPALAGMTPADGDVVRSADDGLPVVLPGEHLLTVDRWHALQSALNERVQTRAPIRRRQPLPLLHGLAVDEGGHKLYRHAPAGRIVRYNCRTVGCPTKTSVSLTALDAFVAETFMAEAGGEPELTLEVIVHGRDNARLRALRGEIAKTTAALGSSRDPAEIQELAARLTLQRQAEAEAEAGSSAGDLMAFKSTGRTLGDAYQAATTNDERRALLAAHIEAVVVTPSIRGGGGRPLAERVRVQWLGN